MGGKIEQKGEEGLAMESVAVDLGGRVLQASSLPFFGSSHPLGVSEIGGYLIFGVLIIRILLLFRVLC